LILLVLFLFDPSAGWARRRRLRNGKSEKREVSLDSNTITMNDIIVKEREEVVGCKEVEDACGYTVKCKCCSDSALFKGCDTMKLISFSKNVDTSSQALTEDAEQDEAGCHLRSVTSNGKDLCIPGNVAAMLVIISNASGNVCQTISAGECTSEVDPDHKYYTRFNVTGNVQDMLETLEKYGHHCKNGETSGQDTDIVCYV